MPFKKVNIKEEIEQMKKGDPEFAERFVILEDEYNKRKETMRKEINGNMDKVRVLRIIEYVGDRDWMEVTLRGGNVPIEGTKEFPSKYLNDSNIIKSCIVDKFPEILGN